MGLVHAEAEIINSGDLEMVRRYLLDQDDVKMMTVKMLVDTDAYNLCINEEIKEQLKLPVVEKRKGMLADGGIRRYEVVDNVQSRFKNRATPCRAVVLPRNSEPLLGAIPLEDIDVIIHTQRQELIVNLDHPYFAQMSFKGMREA